MSSVEKSGFGDSISNFVEKYRALIVTLSLIIVAAIVVFFVYDLNLQNQKKETTIAVEKLEQSFIDWESAAEEEKSASETELLANLDQALTQSGIVKQLALYYKGRYYYSDKKFIEAYDHFLQASNVIENSYLAPNALFLSAISAENANEIEKAKDVYSRLSADSSEKNAYAPRALFSLGRLLESEKKYKEAEAYYQQVVDKFNISNWTKLSKNRIIFLKANSLL